MAKFKTEYKEYLARVGYTDEMIKELEGFIEDAEHCTFEQFEELRKIGVIIRTKKLKKPRNLFVKDGKFYFLEHYYRTFKYCGYFTPETF